MNLILVKEKSFYKLLLTLGLPMAVQGLVSFAINMTDVLMVQLVGENELGACTIASLPFVVFFFVISGVSGGACMVCSQYYGRGDMPAIKKVVAVALNAILLIGGCLSLILAFFPRGVMQLLTHDQVLVGIGAQYLKIVAPTYVLTGFVATYMLVMRSIGEVRFALLLEIVTLLLNIFLNYLLIFGRLGFPAMGVQGSACATLVARGVAFLLCIWFLEKKEEKLGFRLRDLFAKKQGVAKRLFRDIYAVVVGEFLWGLGLAMNNVVFSKTGSKELIAAISEVSVFMQFSVVFIVGFATAVEVIVGQLIGRGEQKKLPAVVRTVVLVALGVGIFSAGLTLLVRDPILNMGKLSVGTKALASRLIGINAVVLLFLAVSSTCMTGLLRGGADTKGVLVIDTLSLWFFAVPLAWVGLHLFKWAPVVVYFCTRVDVFVKLVFAFVRLKIGGWAKEVTHIPSEGILHEQ
ncbi:MAG: MATE family efflux transporter [Oscillospiraceae bacterium]|jgi:putative MATE family efflux protein|nr:MATE family efflux transporter [Oscillospiraceae bacterium]